MFNTLRFLSRVCNACMSNLVVWEGTAWRIHFALVKDRWFNPACPFRWNCAFIHCMRAWPSLKRRISGRVACLSFYFKNHLRLKPEKKTISGRCSKIICLQRRCFLNIDVADLLHLLICDFLWLFTVFNKMFWQHLFGCNKCQLCIVMHYSI